MTGRPYRPRRRRSRVWVRLGCGPVGCSAPLLAAVAVALAVLVLA